MYLVKYLPARNALSNNICLPPFIMLYFSTEIFSLYNCKSCKRERRKIISAAFWNETIFYLFREREKKSFLSFKKQLNLSRANILEAHVCGQVQSPAGLKKMTPRSILFQSMFRSFSPFLTPQPCFVMWLACFPRYSLQLRFISWK